VTSASGEDTNLAPQSVADDGTTFTRSQRIANRMAMPMFAISLLFLGLVATLITTQVYVPHLAELVGNENEPQTYSTELIAYFSTFLLLLLWPVFFIEYFFNAHAACKEPQNPNFQKRLLAACVCPPLRLGATSPAMQHKIWLPGLGWRMPSRQLCKQLQQKLSVPMLITATLILPVLLIEKYFAAAIADQQWLRIVLHTATGFIWLAFTAEFIVMVNASPKKMAYIKANWIDLAIILLPLISFLRSFTAVAKLGRAYRMRGILVKTVRALTLLEVLDRVTGNNPVKKLERLKDQYEDRAEELAELREQIKLLEKTIIDDELTDNTGLPSRLAG